MQQKSFVIIIFKGQKKFHLTCRQLCYGMRGGGDKYEVSYNDRMIIVENNRTKLEHVGLEHFPWTWRVAEGKIDNWQLRDDIFKAIESYIRRDGKPPLYLV